MNKRIFEKAVVAVAALVLVVVTGAHSLELPDMSQLQSQVMGAISGTPAPGTPAPGTPAPGTPGNDNANQNPIGALSSALFKGAIPTGNDGTAPTPQEQQLMDQVGLTKMLSQHLPPLDIPKKLDGKTDVEMAKYAKQLMKRRRELQRKMSKNIMNQSFLMMLYYFFSTNFLISPKIGKLLWINASYRKAINADWIAHQEQLADFLLEYVRIKKVDLGELKKNRIVGAPIMKVPYTRRKYVNFPLWKTEKKQQLPSGTDVGSALNVFKNWWV